MRAFDVGFSFCGLHSWDDMGVEIGNYDEAMNAITPDFTALSETVDGYDGGYYTGTKEGPLNIPLNIVVDKATPEKLNQIGWWLRRGAVGQLIFDHAPYKYYNVRVTSQATPPMYPHYDHEAGMWIYSGVIRVTFTAYTPRAYLIESILTDYPDNIYEGYEGLRSATGILPSSNRPGTNRIAPSGTTQMLLLNQGTAPAKCDVVLTGRMDGGVTVMNAATGQSFTVTAPDTATHTYHVNGERGMTAELVNGSLVPKDTVKTGHFIDVAPCMPFYRELPCSLDDKKLIFNQSVPMTQTNMYANIGTSWSMITSHSGNEVTLAIAPSDFQGYATIARLNPITITMGSGTSLLRIEFIFKDTFY